MYEKHDMWYIVKCFAHWGKWRNASTSNTRSFWVTPFDTRQLQGRDYVRYVSRSQGEKWISHLPQNRSGAAANMPSGAEIFLNSCTFIRHVEKLDFTGWLVLKKARLQSWGTTCHSNTYSILIPFLSRFPPLISSLQCQLSCMELLLERLEPQRDAGNSPRQTVAYVRKTTPQKNDKCYYCLCIYNA